MKTNEDAFQYEHSLDHCVEFFSKAGSIYDNDNYRFYGNNEDILSLFQRAWITNKEVAFKLLLWVRDCRGGAGNRSGFRKCIKWLANKPEDYKWVVENIKLIPKYGRWDDMKSLFNTKVEKSAVYEWVEELLENNILAAKWANRKDIPLYLELKKASIVRNIGDFRRYLAKLRKDHIVESKMCSKNFNKINYENVPSVAMARYTNAFNTNDKDRFLSYKESLIKGNTKINADVLFPYDCVRTYENGDRDIANAQFDALPNYMNDENVLVLADTSGSMCASIGAGKITAYDVSRSLALYCSGKLPKENPFYKKFIQFKSESEFSDWEGLKFSDALNNHHIFNGACGGTRIDKALNLILKTGKMFKVADVNMPSMLLICSDMQFSVGISNNYVGQKGIKEQNIEQLTEIEKCLREFDKEGYTRPQIVYWNLVPYYGQPDTVDSKNVSLVSGFSPSILKSILACEYFSPVTVMMKTLEKYDEGLTIPK